NQSRFNSTRGRPSSGEPLLRSNAGVLEKHSSRAGWRRSGGSPLEPGRGGGVPAEVDNVAADAVDEAEYLGSAPRGRSRSYAIGRAGGSSGAHGRLRSRFRQMLSREHEGGAPVHHGLLRLGLASGAARSRQGFYH